jgi:transcriptional regulator with XRE-family HTH domain
MKNRIRQLRQENGMKQEALANILNVDKSQISRYENQKQDINTESLTKMAEIFNCSINYILGIDNYKNGSKSKIDPYDFIIEKAKSSGITPEKLERLIDALSDTK